MLGSGNIEEVEVTLCDSETVRECPVLRLNRSEQVVTSIVVEEVESCVALEQGGKSAILLLGIMHELVSEQGHSRWKVEMNERMCKRQKRRTKTYTNIDMVRGYRRLVLIKDISFLCVMIQFEDESWYFVSLSSRIFGNLVENC